jgi:hypothetical protein
MSSSTLVALTSVTSIASVSSDGVKSLTAAQPATKTNTESTRVRTIAAGASGVPPSSSLPASSVVSSSESPRYKTIYVTKTALPDSNAASLDLPPGAIAGIAVGGAVFLVLVIGLVYLLLRRRRNRIFESSDVPSTSGSQTTVVGKKSEVDMSEMFGTRDQPIYEANSKVVHEMEGSMPELDGRSLSLESAQSPTTAAMIASRHIMSRGRPVKRDKG